MPAGPTVSPMGNGTPKRSGGVEIARHAVEPAGRDAHDDEVGTGERVGKVGRCAYRHARARQRGYVLGVRTRALETSGVDVFQDELGARGPGRDHKVVDQDRHPLRAPAADDRDPHDDYANGSGREREHLAAAGARQRLIPAPRVPPATVAATDVVVVDAERVGPVTGRTLLAELAGERAGAACVGARPVGQDVHVEDDELEELEPLDRPGDERADARSAGRLDRVRR